MKSKVYNSLFFFSIILSMTSCINPSGGDIPLVSESSPVDSTTSTFNNIAESTQNSQEFEQLLDIMVIPNGTLSPLDLVYQGAFRLPDDSGGMGWEYSGHGMTYFPGGDSAGELDGYPGSLFIVGHDQQLFVGEVSIPKPIISRNLDNLNYAQTLQAQADITGGKITNELAIPRMGIEYLPPVEGMAEGKLYFAVGQHIQGFEPSHGWASIDLMAPEPAGLWVLNGFSNYTTNDYLFEIAESWSDRYAPGYRLATGRFREGVWGGLGPALYAYAPWMDGNPPHEGATLHSVLPLLLFGEQTENTPEIMITESMRMAGYAAADHWWGGAWVTSSAGSSVLFTGTKAIGQSWYGFANGVIWDPACSEDPAIDCPEVPDYPYDNRGFWAEDYMPAILFFNPEDLGKVAKGEAAPYEPQPYALLDLSDYWYDSETNVEIYKRDLVGAAAYDRPNQILYIIERLGDETKSVVHVFKIKTD